MRLVVDPPGHFMQEPTPKVEEEYVPIGQGKQAVPSAYSPAPQVILQSDTSFFPAETVVFLRRKKVRKCFLNIFNYYPIGQDVQV